MKYSRVQVTLTSVRNFWKFNDPVFRGFFRGFWNIQRRESCTSRGSLLNTVGNYLDLWDLWIARKTNWKLLMRFLGYLLLALDSWNLWISFFGSRFRASCFRVHRKFKILEISETLRTARGSEKSRRRNSFELGRISRVSEVWKSPESSRRSKN